MIKIENLYQRAHDYLEKSEWKDQYKLEEQLLPGLKAKSMAFRNGAFQQLTACVADLRMWAEQFRHLGKDEIAKELDQFAADWEEEGLEFLKG
jgi:hypothetical protein